MKRNDFLLELQERLELSKSGLFLTLQDLDDIFQIAEILGMRPPILLDQKYKGPLEGWESEND